MSSPQKAFRCTMCHDHRFACDHCIMRELEAISERLLDALDAEIRRG